jgi:two-component system chemotaxis response regulator CheB
MIVDDSVVVRSLVRRWLTAEGIEVVSAHRSGREAIDNVVRANPDVIILDIEMPDMDGITALPTILERQPGVQVIMASTLTRRNAEISVRCLSLGAADYLPKPDVTRDPNAANDFHRELMAKVKALGAQRRKHQRPERRPMRAEMRAPAAVAPRAVSLAKAPAVIALRPFSRVRPRALAIGSSTGGPQALMTLFKALKAHPLPVPIFITQHMPPNFTAVLADHIGQASGFPAREGVQGMPVSPGHIYVAPGGFHMTVGGTSTEPVIQINSEPPINFCRPAVDPLFRSLAKLFGPSLLVTVLTGMGSDGALGGVAVADAGGTVLAQDEASSVVWGMPGQTAQAGACAAVLPLPEIGPRILSLISGSAA